MRGVGGDSEYERLVLEHQAAVRGELERMGAAFDVVPLAAHPDVEFRIRPDAPDGPRLSVFVGISWSIHADGYTVLIVDYVEDVDVCIEECRKVVALLLSHPLRIRVRKQFLGFGMWSGAIWIPWTEGGVWWGDQAAASGRGELREYAWPWFERV